MQIKTIINEEINCLTKAIKDGKNPYHMFSLATINNNKAEVRTVVLREVDTTPLKIYFNADYRSPKVAQLNDSPLCSALFYDIERRIQLRLSCLAIIHYNSKISKKIWDKTALQSKKCYMGSYAPSTRLEDWDPNIPLKYLKKDPELEDSKKGYKNFAHIELEIIDLEVLQLRHDGHIRCGFNNKKEYFFISP